MKDLASRIVFREFAIAVNPADNVSVVKKTIPAGSIVEWKGSDIAIDAGVEQGHRFALCDIPAGAFVLQYAQPIGTSKGIRTGEAITHANMTDDVPIIRTVPENLHTPPPHYVPEDQRAMFDGFVRSDGRVGTRNYILLVPTSMCASHEVQQISTIAEYTLYNRDKYPNVDGITAIPHNKGCGCQDGSPVDVLLRTLSNYADHPNVGGVILLELGCEKTNLSVVEAYLRGLGRKMSKPLVRFGIQDVGGTQAAINAGLEAVGRMLPEVNHARRERVPISKLVLGVKCGGSDAFSGISANPS